jgi:hypothetical protein
LNDEIVELAAEVGVLPSFPIPQVLATRIATEESFGIIPVPHAIVEELGFKSSQVSNIKSDTLLSYNGTSVHLLT